MKVPEISRQKNMASPTTTLRIWPIRVCHCGHSETIPEQTKRYSALFVMTDRYKKLAIVVQTCKKTASLNV